MNNLKRIDETSNIPFSLPSYIYIWMFCFLFNEEKHCLPTQIFIIVLIFHCWFQTLETCLRGVYTSEVVSSFDSIEKNSLTSSGMNVRSISRSSRSWECFRLIVLSSVNLEIKIANAQPPLLRFWCS